MSFQFMFGEGGSCLISCAVSSVLPSSTNTASNCSAGKLAVTLQRLFQRELMPSASFNIGMTSEISINIAFVVVGAFDDKLGEIKNSSQMH